MFVALFHSVFGLRGVELAAAERLRAAGHQVVVPDLFDGVTNPGDFDAAFDHLDRIGWSTVLERAHDALADAPAETVLGGLSMGAALVGDIWPARLDAAGAFYLHAAPPVPAGIRTGTPVQLHFGAGDPFVPPERLARFRESAERNGAYATVREYEGVGHFFTDETLPDHDADAATSTWRDVLGMLDLLEATR
ncbi:dienelactone hydrolase family protein [Pseudonocardia sp. TRM90224]|uniref:dienelactone hydrolase family protein n=1 Tax=Pseudonocardia sp. TRM90224 TaxID=2812678 RepID=UPI001E525759|nr:dienelactone hydrolase family protein [Pseudonocardia sp. TRM90224]